MTFEEWLKTWPTSLNNDFTVREISIMEEAWNASAEAHKSRWIPVSERLPDKEDYYPVLVDGMKHFQSIFYDSAYKSWNTSFNVTHWLELPEMPE